MAARLAALVGDEFVVRPWKPGEAADGVVLSDSPDLSSPGEGSRMIGIVSAWPPAAWPVSWYGVVPADGGRLVLARTIANAFADLDAVAARDRLGRELGELNEIGIQLSAERDVNVLLQTILVKAREITCSDAGSLYVVEENDESRRLRFVLAQNASRSITFKSVTLPLDGDSVAGYVALTGDVVNLADAYSPPSPSPFQINRAFDEQTGYRTKSMLVVPMRTPQGETLGVLQLINCRPDFGGLLETAADVERHVRPFDEHQVRLACSLASQAAVALNNRRLYDSISELFEGFVKASVTAIESRDPTTSGHSFRVADLTIGLAQVVDRVSSGPYREATFTADELRELRYAALLHDFGKVGVREQVLVKATKLYPADLERIRHRVELLRSDLALRATQDKLAAAVRGQADYAERAAAADGELTRALAELQTALDLIVVMNEPAVQAKDFASQLLWLTAQSWEDHRGERRTILHPDEASMLTIPRGSLTERERGDIERHVTHTFQFLAQIPWTHALRRVPELARSHHEKLNGAGYPLGIQGADIPVQTRMMTISDIYDALTASDRPYKKAVPAEVALDILQAERRAGALDGVLLDLFIEARVFDRVR